MTTISATMIADSVGPAGQRLSSLQLRYPRWIHAEGKTHRIIKIGEDFEFEAEVRTPSLMDDENLSRNASSSRAAPVANLIADVRRDPAVPMFWGKNQRGMQAGAEHDADVDGFSYEPFTNSYTPSAGLSREQAWLAAMELAIISAEAFDRAGYHKQIVNRLLEPFSHINVLVTATEWENFFELRDHPDAEPHIQVLAREIRKAMDASTPTKLQPGEWHLPYVTDEDRELLNLSAGTLTSSNGISAPFKSFKVERQVDELIKLSVARCARVSYLTHDGKKPPIEKDLELYNDLVGSRPLHASPAEHQATPDYRPIGESWASQHLHGNFTGFIQNRKVLESSLLAA